MPWLLTMQEAVYSSNGLNFQTNDNTAKGRQKPDLRSVEGVQNAQDENESKREKTL